MVLGAIVIVVLGVIVINYFRSNQGTTTPAITSQQEEQPTVKRGEGPVTYTVTAGEDLWSIAEKQYGSGYNWVDIADANNLSNPNVIEVGQELTIPDVEPKTQTVTETLGPTETQQGNAIAGATYTVVKGDNLWNIAVRAYGDGYKWVDIANANSLVNPGIIHSGNVLTIPR